MIINGFCDEKFGLVFEEFERNFTEREDVGASFCATIEGEVVIDLWGGYRDKARSKPWEQDTIVNVFSSTKPFYFLAIAILADQGRLNYHDKVIKYWPEYGQKGKQDTEIRHFLSHSAGLPGFGKQLSLEDICDWDLVISILEEQEPWWEPGAMAHYHALTQGFLVGEIIKRVTDQSLGTFVQKAITEPLKTDFHIGLSRDVFPRVATTLLPPPHPNNSENKKSISKRSNPFEGRVEGHPTCMPAETNSDLWRLAEVPGGNGHGNARSIARVASLIANAGKVDGITLLSEDGIKHMLEPQIMMGDVELGMGPGLNSERWGGPKGAKVSWWGGHGGSTNFADLSNRVGLSFVMNQMNYDIVGGPRGESLHRGFYKSLDFQKN